MALANCNLLHAGLHSLDCACGFAVCTMNSIESCRKSQGGCDEQLYTHNHIDHVLSHAIVLGLIAYVTEGDRLTSLRPQVHIIE